MPARAARPPLAGIRCQECGRKDDYEERGWKAYIADVNEVVILCPECAEREFGDRGSS
jgi:hypothetical protein